MPPAATLRHSVVERAVGAAANGRNLAGLAPSTLTNTPLIWTRPASTATAARTPPSLRSLPTKPAGSDRGPTTRTSGWCSLVICFVIGADVWRAFGSGLVATVLAPEPGLAWPERPSAPAELGPGMAPTDALRSRAFIAAI